MKYKKKEGQKIERFIFFFRFYVQLKSFIVFTDVWSAGCVVAELLLGQPIFPGDSGVDQLVEIIKVLGTPTRDQIREMNPNYTEFKFPQIKAHPWQKVAYHPIYSLYYALFVRYTLDCRDGFSCSSSNFVTAYCVHVWRFRD